MATLTLGAGIRGLSQIESLRFWGPTSNAQMASGALARGYSRSIEADALVLKMCVLVPQIIMEVYVANACSSSSIHWWTWTFL